MICEINFTLPHPKYPHVYYELICKDDGKLDMHLFPEAYNTYFNGSLKCIDINMGDEIDLVVEALLELDHYLTPPEEVSEIIISLPYKIANDEDVAIYLELISPHFTIDFPEKSCLVIVLSDLLFSIEVMKTLDLIYNIHPSKEAKLK